MIVSEARNEPANDPAGSKGQAAVFDLSLLRGVCEMPEQRRKQLIDTLSARYQLVVTEVLIEEAFNTYASGKCEKHIARQILNVLVGLQSTWMESPLELVFRELVLGQDIRADLRLSPQKASLLFEALRDPDSLQPEAAQWLLDRRKEKEERLQTRREYQEARKQQFRDQPYQFAAPLDFMECAIRQLCVEIDSPALRVRRLNRYLGRNLKSLHPDSVTWIERAFSEATFDSLDRTRFTRNYLLAEILYDLAPISKVANPFGQDVAAWPQKAAKQINDEEDQQYVAASLMFHRLLTCDEGMHKIADLFAKRCIWRGKSILIPRHEIRRLEDFLQ